MTLVSDLGGFGGGLGGIRHHVILEVFLIVDLRHHLTQRLRRRGRTVSRRRRSRNDGTDGHAVVQQKVLLERS